MPVTGCACCLDLLSSTCGATVKLARRYPRATALLTACSVLLLLFFSPGGYDPVYSACRLHRSTADESVAGADHVTLGHLALDFGRDVRLRLFSNSSAIGRARSKLSAAIGRTLPPHAAYRLTTEPRDRTDRLGLVFPGTGIRLDVRRVDSCYRIVWRTCSGRRLRDSIRLTGAHWYGGELECPSDPLRDGCMRIWGLIYKTS